MMGSFCNDVISNFIQQSSDHQVYAAPWASAVGLQRSEGPLIPPCAQDQHLHSRQTTLPFFPRRRPKQDKNRAPTRSRSTPCWNNGCSCTVPRLHIYIYIHAHKQIILKNVLRSFCNNAILNLIQQNLDHQVYSAPQASAAGICGLCLRPLSDTTEK